MAKESEIDARPHPLPLPQEREVPAPAISQPCSEIVGGFQPSQRLGRGPDRARCGRFGDRLGPPGTG